MPVAGEGRHCDRARGGKGSPQPACEPAAETVAERPRDKLADSVCKAEDEDELRQVEIAVVAVAGHHWHDHAEILPAEIIRGIESPGREENAEPPSRPFRPADTI